MKDKIFGVLQRVGRSFMLPIAILPVAGLLLGVGGSFTNETMLETYGLMGIMGPGTALNAILQVMSAAGDIVFANLPIIFAMGVAIGMAKKEKEVAALSAAIAFFIMHASIGAMIVNTYCNLPSWLSETLVYIAHKGLVLTLFFIGAGLSVAAIKKVGVKPLVLAIIIWIIIGVSSFFVVRATM